jgi:hypothetical protein
MKIQVLKKGSTKRRDGEICPWLLEVPPETAKK